MTVFYRGGGYYYDVAKLFGVSEGYLPYVFYHVALAVVQQLHYEISWPDVDERAYLSSLTPEFENVIGFFKTCNLLRVC